MGKAQIWTDGYSPLLILCLTPLRGRIWNYSVWISKNYRGGQDGFAYDYEE